MARSFALWQRDREPRSYCQRRERCSPPKLTIADSHESEELHVRTTPFAVRVSFLPDVPELDIPFFLSFPIFFGLTARVIPLRSGLRLFCFVGSALNNTGFPPTKQTLACDSKPLALCRAPNKTGQKEKVKAKCLIYMLSGIDFGAVCSPAV